MKNTWWTSLGLLVILTGSVCLSGCSSATPEQTSTAPATIAYTVGSIDTAIKGYSAVSSNGSSPISTITLPASYSAGPIATDSIGQIYVGVAMNPIDSLNLGNIFIYPPNSTGAATPSRIINLNAYDIFAIAVDRAGRVYVFSQPENGSPTVAVYSANASGAAAPLRTIQLTNLLPTLRDIAVDAAGNIYVAGYFTTGNAIEVYSPSATGAAAPTRTITLGSSTIYGVATDAAGDVFASVCPGCGGGTNLAIEEFASGADGAATPINTISLPASLVAAEGGPVRLDGAGNIFTSIYCYPPGANSPSLVLYSFEPTATGNAVPNAQIIPADRYNSFFAIH